MRTCGWLLVAAAVLGATAPISAQQPVIVADHCGAMIAFLPTKPWKIKASDFHDVYIVVQESRTGSLLFGVGANSDAGLTGSVILNERNFDLGCAPTGLDDIQCGHAFRGCGQELRLEAVPGTQLLRYTRSFRAPHVSCVPANDDVGLTGCYVFDYNLDQAEVAMHEGSHTGGDFDAPPTPESLKQEMKKLRQRLMELHRQLREMEKQGKNNDR